MSFLYRDETKELNDAARKTSGGSFISLLNGITHYELSNEGQENTVVLVHGFSVPGFIFDPTFNFLTTSRFRVLRYDLFGRGFSDRPDTRYNIDLFVKQLSDLLNALRFNSPVNLIGLSMGGPITATFTTRHPSRVRSLTLIDPAGAKPVSSKLLLKLAKMPIVAETLFGLVGSERLIKSVAKDFFDPDLVEHFIGKYRVQMQLKGFKRALLSSIRNNMLDSFVDTYEQVGKAGKPVLLFWGRNDRAVPFEHSHHLRVTIPNMEFHPIENCGHIPHYERPEEVNPILLDFLERNNDS